MISVCMATYNGERFIGSQLDSVLSQLGAQDELIVSDDGSTDRTEQIIRSREDSRIRVLHHTPCGVPFNFENAITAARGDYIFLCDQDDLWRTDKVRRCMAEFEKGMDLVVTDAAVIDGAGQMIIPSFFDIKQSGPGFWRNLRQNTYLGCCMAFRACWCRKLLPLPRGINMHDEWIGSLISFSGGQEAFIREPLTLYRQHDGNVTRSASKSTTTLTWKIHKRVVLLWSCIGRRIGVA